MSRFRFRKEEFPDLTPESRTVGLDGCDRVLMRACRSMHVRPEEFGQAELPFNVTSYSLVHNGTQWAVVLHPDLTRPASQQEKRQSRIHEVCFWGFGSLRVSPRYSHGTSGKFGNLNEGVPLLMRMVKHMAIALSTFLSKITIHRDVKPESILWDGDNFYLTGQYSMPPTLLYFSHI